MRAVAIGDFQTQIGQGLNMWTGYAFGKTADVVNTKKSAIPLKPYTSVDENRFPEDRVDLGYKDFSLTLFGSVKTVDGATTTVDTSSTDDSDFFVPEETVSSINTTGFHRTNSEISRKGSLTEIIYGANFRYNHKNLHIGAAAIELGVQQTLCKTSRTLQSI
ncbi:MAG: hypothetical protein R2779_04915 [Crocinitomicaceae bacterium]